MKKLKKKMITKYLQKVRMPMGMTLKEFNSFYSKLASKYGDSKDIRLVERTGYYNAGGFWLVERRLETDAELAQRQKALDIGRAKRQALMERIRAQRKIEAAKRRAAEQERKKAMKKAQLEKKVEEVKTLVKILKSAGFQVSKTTTGTASRS